MKKLLAALTTVLAVGTAHADDLFVSISTAAPMAQGAALVLAGQALEQKAAVRVLLCDAAADIALATPPASLPVLKPRNVTTQQMLQGVIKAGAKVEVCALYLPNTGRQATDLLPGVTPAKPAEVASHLIKPGVNILSF